MKPGNESLLEGGSKRQREGMDVVFLRLERAWDQIKGV